MLSKHMDAARIPCCYDGDAGKAAATSIKSSARETLLSPLEQYPSLASK